MLMILLSLLLMTISSLMTKPLLPTTTTLMLLTLISTTALPTNISPLMTSTLARTHWASTPLLILTLWLSALMMVASKPLFMSPHTPKKFTTTLLSLTIALVLAFTFSNLLLFYIMFETSLVPTVVMIITWGHQPERLQASMYLVLYTLTASLPLLLAITWLFRSQNHLSLSLPQTNHLLPALQAMLMAPAILLAFLAKLPMFLLHLWLPKAHVEAPVAGSMILAGILLKLGGYGLIQVSLLYPTTPHYLSPALLATSLWGAMMTSMVCLRQSDLKSLIAYSSVGHMALLIAGVSTLSRWAAHGALLMMIAHGLSSSALFALANNIYETTTTRSLALTKGLLNIFPSISLWWFIFAAINMAAPPSVNLLSEILLITTILTTSTLTLLALPSISFLAAAYSLYLYSSLHHGPPTPSYNPLHMSSQPHTLALLHFAPLLLLSLKPDTLTLF